MMRMYRKCIFPKLSKKIKEKHGTQNDFAHALQISTKTLSFKMTGISDWTLSEITAACKLLEIPPSEVGYYFIERRIR